MFNWENEDYNDNQNEQAQIVSPYTDIAAKLLEWN